MCALTRSEIMSRIGSRDTGPELALRRSLFRLGLRYRIHRRIGDAGRVDIAFVGLKIAVLIDGCFWHGCPRHGTEPKTHSVFWKTKLDGNRSRDRRQNLALRRSGWKVLRFWEHQIEEDLERVVAKVLQAVEEGRKGKAWMGES